ncbi:MAG: TraX family protein [Bacilli bacterium]
MEETKKNWGLSNLVLKIIACVTMTLDHIGVVIKDNNETLAYIFRICGRIALPIFILLLIEGLTHTKNIKKYLLRLAISAGFLYIAMTLIQFIGITQFGINGNIFIDLTLLVLCYIFLFKFEGKKRLLVILPLLYFVGSFVIKILYWFDYIFLFSAANSLLCEYDIIAPVLFFIIIFGYNIYDKKIAKAANNNLEVINEFKTTQRYQISKNAIASISVAIITIICYCLTYVSDYANVISWYTDCALQSYMLISAVFILFYNGKLGKHNKVIQYSFYIYYPLHLLLIYGIYEIVLLIIGG